MKLTKVALAVSGLLATLACGIATAGNYQTQSTSVAREVIVGNAQQIVAPQVSYSFGGPVRNPAQTTYFQIQLALADGEWVTPGVTAGFPSNANIANGGNVALVDSAGLTVATAWGTLLDASNKKVLYATFAIPAGVGVNNARVVWNAANTGAALGGAAVTPDAANLLKVTKLKTLVGTVGECDQDIKQLTATVTQYPNITDPSFMATVANESSASEHKLVNAQNSGPVLSFPVNLKLAGTAAAAAPVQDYVAAAKKFDTTVAGTTGTGLTATLGTVTYTKPASGYDTNLTNVYGAVAATTPGVAVASAGAPELKNYSVALTGSYASTAKFWLSAGACADGGYATATAPVSGLVTVTDAVAADIAVGAALNVCYGVDGNASIPTSSITAALVLNKAPDNAGDVAVRSEEQPNSCKATFTVGGGIQIDVRNYASFATFGTTGPATTLRIINNSETATADLYAQMIYADGKYGPYGRLPDLAPREVLNISNKNLEALLTTKAAISNPFGTASVYTNASGSAVVAGPKAGVSDRVRIVSTTGTTLRVQSYMVVGGTVIDTSNAQGVDFENLVAGRVAPTARDAQPVSQDAIKGLAK